MNQKTLLSQRKGFSLVEIMVALTISLTLIAGVVTIFIKNKQTYLYQEISSRLQENGRTAVTVLNRIIRMTDFSGCSRNNNVVNVLNNTASWNGNDWWQNFGSNGTTFGNQFLSLVGFDGNQAFPAIGNSGKFNTLSGGDRIPGTDAMISLGGSGGYVITGVNNAAVPPTFTLSSLNRSAGGNSQNQGGQIKRGDLMMVCNAQTTSIFQVGDIFAPPTITYKTGVTAPTPGNATTNLGANYNNNSTMMDYVPSAFYIGESNSKTNRALYQLYFEAGNTGAMRRREIIEGVENMQIHYGMDFDGDQIIDQYLDATNVADWSRAASVRIHLLMTNYHEENEDNEFEKDDVLTQAQIYIFPNDVGDATIIGRAVLAPDLRVYQVFSTTIGIRNRIR